jgi:hypothetical protein
MFIIILGELLTKFGLNKPLSINFNTDFLNV